MREGCELGRKRNKHQAERNKDMGVIVLPIRASSQRGIIIRDLTIQIVTQCRARARRYTMVTADRYDKRSFPTMTLALPTRHPDEKIPEDVLPTAHMVDARMAVISN